MNIEKSLSNALLVQKYIGQTVYVFIFWGCATRGQGIDFWDILYKYDYKSRLLFGDSWYALWG